jgi:hypothetical protein
VCLSSQRTILSTSCSRVRAHTFVCDRYPNHAKDVDTVAALYRSQVFPRMSAAQRALYIPPGYTVSNTTTHANCTDKKFNCSAKAWCGDIDCARGIARWAAATMEWASSEPQLIGLAPYFYACSGGGEAGWINGAGCSPRERKAWEAIARKIVRDVH